MDQWFTPLLFFLAALSVPMLILQEGNQEQADTAIVTAMSWATWGAFTANFVIRLALARDRRAQARALAWDIILIVGQPVYAIGPRKADAFLAFLRLIVVIGSSLQRGRLLRRTGRKFRNQPLRVVAFIVPFLWITSAALIYRTETDSGVIGSFGDGLWWSAVTMATVGYGDISPKTTGGRAVAIMTMVVGIGMFSLVTAKLAEALFVQRTRGNRREVIEVGHTLVLGWSPKVFTIVEQLVIANGNRPNATIVVLAERDFNDMAEDIAVHVPGLAHSTTTVLARNGSPSDPADLALCRPDNARSIIVIDDTEEDAGVVRSLLALMHGGAELPVIPIVAEIDNPATAEALRLALDGRVTVVNPTGFTARTAAQACRSAGVTVAYEDLLGFEGAELYIRHVPEAVGHAFGALINAFTGTRVVGRRRGDGSITLNPPLEDVVVDDDQLILLAEDDGLITFDGAHRSVVRTMATPEPREPEHVVIFGWNALCPRILAELDGYVPPGSRFTVAVDPTLSGGDEEAFLPANLINAEVVLHRASDVAYADLVDVITEDHANHAMVLCYRNGLSIAESDALALVTTLQVRRALENRGSDTTVVTELLDLRDVALAPPSAAGEFIVSERITSLLLTQLSENDHLAAVFDDLLDPRGASLHSRRAEHYCTPGQPTTFGEVAITAARRGETAIGYRLARDVLDASRAFGAVMNPPAAASVVLCDADQVLVIASDR